jgi:alpha-1,3-rhamnosyl/mannosyltransferase
VLDTRTVTRHFPGVGRAAAGLARALAQVRPAADIRLLHAEPPDPRLPLDVLAGIACSCSPFDWRQHRVVPHLLRAARASVYHCPFYLMPIRPGVPSIVTCYDLIPLLVAGLFGPARRAAYRAAHAVAFATASAIVVPSAATRDQVVRFFPRHASKVHVIPLGCAGALPGTSASGSAHRRALGVPARYVLHVGSNKPHKNLALLHRAWRRVVDGGRAGDASLVLVGPRDPRYDDGGSAGRNARVYTLGEVSDEALAALYEGAALLVLPSRAEGFGLPALEAMAHGTPVACAEVPALVEVTAGAAALFAPDDEAEVARVIARVLGDADERASLAAAGRARAAAFAWDRVAADTWALYVAVVGGAA